MVRMMMEAMELDKVRYMGLFLYLRNWVRGKRSKMKRNWTIHSLQRIDIESKKILICFYHSKAQIFIFPNDPVFC